MPQRFLFKKNMLNLTFMVGVGCGSRFWVVGRRLWVMGGRGGNTTIQYE